MSKKELAEKLGFDFEEVKAVLSEETLLSMQKTEIRGQEGVDDICRPIQDICSTCTTQDQICGQG